MTPTGSFSALKPRFLWARYLPNSSRSSSRTRKVDASTRNINPFGSRTPVDPGGQEPPPITRHPLFREKIEGSKSLDIEAASRLQAEARLEIAECEIQSRTIKAVNLVPIIALSHEADLRLHDNVLLDVGRGCFVRGCCKRSSAFESRRRCVRLNPRVPFRILRRRRVARCRNRGRRRLLAKSRR